MLRLANAGWTYRQIAPYVGCHPRTVKATVARYRRQGEAGLADQPHPGRASAWTPTIEQFVRDCLAQDRAWTCNQLSEAIQESFQVSLQREALRLQLKRMGSSWQRTRYVPAKEADPEEVALAKQILEGVKKGWQRGRWNCGGWTNVA